MEPVQRHHLQPVTYDSDYNAGGKVIPTGGKIAVDSPEVLYKNELSYRRAGFEGHLTSDFLGKRYFTYTDDNFVGSRAVVDFGAGTRSVLWIS